MRLKTVNEIHTIQQDKGGQGENESLEEPGCKSGDTGGSSTQQGEPEKSSNWHDMVLEEEESLTSKIIPDSQELGTVIAET